MLQPFNQHLQNDVTAATAWCLIHNGRLLFISEVVNCPCSSFSFDTLGFRHAMTMAFAIDEINKKINLLPNVTLGYRIYDNCGALVVGFSGALSLASGTDEQFKLLENCSGTPPVLGIVGDHYSTFSIAIANVLGLYKMPLVSFYLFDVFVYFEEITRFCRIESAVMRFLYL